MAQLTGTALRSNASGFNDVIRFENSSGIQHAVPIRAYIRFDSDWLGPGVGSTQISFNVDIVEDRGVGTWTINFTNALPSANYAFSGCSDRPTTVRACTLVQDGNFTNTTGLLYVKYMSDDNNPYNGDYCSCIVIG